MCKPVFKHNRVLLNLLASALLPGFGLPLAELFE
jgi:hypothetical protein